jgi:hypothetical protein
LVVSDNSYLNDKWLGQSDCSDGLDYAQSDQN